MPPLVAARLEFSMQVISLLIHSMRYRFNSGHFSKVREVFSQDNIIALLNVLETADCRLFTEVIRVRTDLLVLYNVLHIDFKDCLVNERNKYFHTKPVDMQYEEDTYYNHGYDKTIVLIMKELAFTQKHVIPYLSTLNYNNT